MIRKYGLAALLLATLSSASGAETTVRIGLAEDPDVLDPTLARTYVGRIVFASLCDKLFEINDKLELVPQLALSQETSSSASTRQRCRMSTVDTSLAAWRTSAGLASRDAG